MIFGRSIARGRGENGPSFKPEHLMRYSKLLKESVEILLIKYVKDFRVSLLYLMDMKKSIYTYI